MLKNFAALIFVLFIAAGGANAQKNDGKDEAAIRANVEQMVKGWNMKSGVEFAKPFAEDSDYVVVNGMYIKGRALNAASHQQIFDTIYKEQDIAVTVEQIRFLRPDVAVVHVLSERFPKGDKSQTIKGRITLVTVKNGDKWEIAAFQNTLIQTEAGGK